MKTAIRQLFSRTLEVVSLFIIPTKRVVIHGFPANEGNAVEIARALSSMYGGEVVWLIDDPNNWTISAESNILPVKKVSVSGLWAYLTAECIFFTHGLFGDCRPGGDRIIVNLWHGDGFKFKAHAHESERSVYPADFVVGSTEMLTHQKAKDFRMPINSMLVTGNPRVDQFAKPSRSEVLKALGIDPSRPFVLWLPTFRKTAGKGSTPGWSDVSEDFDLGAAMQKIVDQVTMLGIQVVIKPHPQETATYRLPGATILSGELLSRHGSTLYQLLGSSAGIITDYSSVWTDYLILDRPIAFFMPDKEDYLATRGFAVPQIFDNLPGPDLQHADGLSHFVSAILGDEDQTAPIRMHAAELLGAAAATPGSISRNLVLRLDRLGALQRGGVDRNQVSIGNFDPLILFTGEE